LIVNAYLFVAITDLKDATSAQPLVIHAPDKASAFVSAILSYLNSTGGVAPESFVCAAELRNIDAPDADTFADLDQISKSRNVPPELHAMLKQAFEQRAAENAAGHHQNAPSSSAAQ
jgi:hypothetical protein